MKSYNQSDLFALLTSAAADHENLTPDPVALAIYREKRLARAVKALRSRNVLLYTEGERTSLNFNDIATIYTQPAGVRLLICGYSNNMRYGNTEQNSGAGGAHLEDFVEMHRLRVVGPSGEGAGARTRTLVDNLMPSQAGVVGESRYTTPLLPAPFILEANEQLAIDLGWDTAADAAGATMPADIAAEAFVFFAIRVRDRLAPDDYADINDIRAYIAAHEYQRAIYLNCVSPGVESISFSGATAGAIATCLTRPANGPVLITGVGTSLFASKLTITDTGDGHSFTLNRSAQSSALMMPNQDNDPALATSNEGAPAAAPIWTQYTEFPIPHLLRPGASLRVDLVLGGPSQAAGANALLDAKTGNVLIFQGVSV